MESEGLKAHVSYVSFIKIQQLPRSHIQQTFVIGHISHLWLQRNLGNKIFFQLSTFSLTHRAEFSFEWEIGYWVKKQTNKQTIQWYLPKCSIILDIVFILVFISASIFPLSSYPKGWAYGMCVFILASCPSNWYIRSTFFPARLNKKLKIKKKGKKRHFFHK